MQIEMNQTTLTRRSQGWLRMPILVKEKVQLAENSPGAKDFHRRQRRQRRHHRCRRYCRRQKSHVSWNVWPLVQSHDICSVPLLLITLPLTSEDL